MNSIPLKVMDMINIYTGLPTKDETVKTTGNC